MDEADDIIHDQQHHEDVSDVLADHDSDPSGMTTCMPPVDSEMFTTHTDDSEATRKRLYEHDINTNHHLNDEDEEARKRPRKSQPPPKKLNEDQWSEMFARLVKYKEIHGDCLVPKRYQEDPKLGTWVETQRVQYKKLQGDGDAVTPNNRLNAERLEKLESVGFAWSAKNVRKVKPPAPASPTSSLKSKRPLVDVALRAQARMRVQDQTWNEMYARLVAYKEKYGDCLVPKKFEEDPKLASWVENQRVIYNREYKSAAAGSRASSLGPKVEAPEPTSFEAKSPEEWAVEMSGATVEDAAEVAATMAEATMEVVNDVVDVATITAMEVAAEEMADAANGITTDNSSHEIPTSNVHELNVDSSHGFDVDTDELKYRNLPQDRKEKLDALGFVWSLRSKRVDDHWDHMFQQLVDYKAAHGDCLVPSRYEENYKLGKWVETQRYEYTKLLRATGGAINAEDGNDSTTDKGGKVANPRLTSERRTRLESIGFEWKVKHKMKRYYDRQWDYMFAKLLKYKADNGHCMVPKRYPPDAKLGTWVHTQRIQYRKTLAGSLKKEDGEEEADEEYESDAKSGKCSDDQFFRLTDERRKRLENAGFVWSARDSEKSAEPSRITRNSYDDQWDAMFLRLQAYKERHGDCLVPKRCKEDQKLGTWVDTQRVQFKKMRKKLDRQGIPYRPPELEEPQENDADQEGVSRKPIVGRLTDDRIRRLETLGFVWSLRDDWQKHYNELIEYKKEHGHCNVPARYPNNRRLGIWVSAQRQQYKQLYSEPQDSTKPKRATPLTRQRIELLDELRFTWTIRSRDSLGESWNQRLDELKEYKATFGSCLVPSRYPPNPELGIWVGTQRTQYRLFQQAKANGSRLLNSPAMNEDRIRQLEEMGFVWALRSGPDNIWRKHIVELGDFRATHGHCNVPSQYKGNPQLGDWASAMRDAYKLRNEGKPCILDEEKIAELAALGFGWYEPSSEQAEATNNEVTTIAPQDDEDDETFDVGGPEAAVNDVRMAFGHDDTSHPLHAKGHHAGPYSVNADHLIQRAMNHATT